ncbi:hypothetical protein QEZ52_14940 [Aliisedimentitalea scapharcae]|uniref:Uncharacterized protein n=1 Tax=Aliisedimentitalea scapharcae TaxID=1524259 RepID=A0ABZ2XRF3_9RHOB|nr:hypothetical protein K3727_14855 [Rhodobacteraceae bacterium M382]
MLSVTALIYTPIAALLIGAIAGLLAGKYLEGRKLWLLPGLLSLVGLATIIRLAAIPEGGEEAAFFPLVMLTGAILPGLFTVILGTLGGRAMAGRPTL